MTGTHKTSLFLILFSSIFIAVGIIIFVPTLNLINHWIRTTGEVISLVEYRSSDWANTFAPVVRYKCWTRDTTATSNMSSTSHPNVGDTIWIYCSEERPEEFVIDSFIDKYFWLIFVWAWCIILFIAIGILIYQRYRNDSIIQLRSSGERIEWTVLLIRQNTLVTMMNKHPFIIEVEYRDSLNSYYLFKSDNLWKDPSEYIQPWMTLWVFVERGNLKKYWVDTSFLESESTL